MNSLRDVLHGHNNQTIKALAKQVGVKDGEVETVVDQLLPVFAYGIKQWVGDEQQAKTLFKEIESHGFSEIFEHPEWLGKKEVVQEGNMILGEFFHSKEVSRDVAKRISEETGVKEGKVREMLPLVATTIMGALGKEIKGNGKQGFLGFIKDFLDQDGDGSVLDDIVGYIGKFGRKKH